MTGSKIEWTDHTFNPWIGCTKVSAGCLHCYAETMDKRFHRADGHWGKGVPRRRTSPDNWKEPLRWQKMAAEGYFVEVRRDGAFIARGDVRKLAKDTIQPGDRVVQVRPRVFCASMADWLDDEVAIEWLADLLWLINRTPNLDWQLLTKRPENWRERVGAAAAVLNARNEPHRLHHWQCEEAPENVWIGTSVETQRCADVRIPALLKIPARVRFLSCEPLLGAVDIEKPLVESNPPEWREQLRSFLDRETEQQPSIGLHWVICGGESGDGARPTHVKWARSLRDQCAAAGVAFFFKQWGEHVDGQNMPDETIEFRNSPQGPGMAPLYWAKPDGELTSDATYRVGKRAAGRMLDGVLHGAFPENVKSEPRAEDGQ
jgi:protein gp37